MDHTKAYRHFIVSMLMIAQVHCFKLFPVGANALEPAASERKTLRFKESLPAEVTRVRAGEDIVFECEAGGSPVPTIHWLYRGSRIPQGKSQSVLNDEAYFEQTRNNQEMGMLQLGNTRGRFQIDCLNPEHSGEYTCVAQTPVERIVSTTFLEVVGEEVDCSSESASGSAAHIYMWESQRLEVEGANVQLYCRAAGSPPPEITWYDRNGDVIRNNGLYRTLKNGDLLVKNVNWMEHMGSFTCRATNQHGEDEKSTFFYPTQA